MKFLNLIPSISNYFTKREERKQAKETAQAKLRLARESNDQQIQLSESEWEAMSLESGGESWKDEYVTVVITLWLPVLLVGCVFNSEQIITGVVNCLHMATEAGINMGKMTEVVVYAAVGIKAVKGLRR
jgi:hypothetical protein